MKQSLEQIWSRLNEMIQLLPADHKITTHLLNARTEIEMVLAMAPPKQIGASNA